MAFARYLVLATGSSYAYRPKELADVDRALIVGAGPVGLELVGEIKDVWPHKQATIVDPAEQLLPGFAAERQDGLRRQLDELDIRPRYNHAYAIGDLTALARKHSPRSAEHIVCAVRLGRPGPKRCALTSGDRDLPFGAPSDRCTMGNGAGLDVSSSDRRCAAQRGGPQEPPAGAGAGAGPGCRRVVVSCGGIGRLSRLATVDELVHEVISFFVVAGARGDVVSGFADGPV
ncbi:NAD-binding protein [Frankia sp. AgKG'84/4]|uniref:NAD-binding protein n=1 Tax=Frankia sp. AgKG'84/4 TaxID=573490 RepID=UPI0020103AEA|nr:FAD-dependent oxidoreductase [Frankia sp. AgKG'84/4]MCL9792764.1 FAD-dependent oxidoreductase [Frankia sp. AgKG'84/4]